MSESEDLTPDEQIELYSTALHQIEQAKRERMRKFPRIEALREHWKEQFEGEELKDSLHAQVLIDVLLHDVEKLLDEGEEDPIDVGNGGRI